MSQKIFRSVSTTAAGLSDDLHQAIVAIGPISLRRRNSKPLLEVLCRSVAGQQLSTAAARTIWGRVLDDADSVPLQKYLQRVTVEQLRMCGLSNAKSKTMKAIVSAAETGKLNKQQLQQMSQDQRAAVLTEIWGVGQWTSDMMGIFYFGDKDIWPDNDVTATKTLQRLTSKRRKTALTAARFAPYRSYLAMYMYRFADVGVPSA